jgi:hypothetical protein
MVNRYIYICVCVCVCISTLQTGATRGRVTHVIIPPIVSTLDNPCVLIRVSPPSCIKIVGSYVTSAVELALERELELERELARELV